MSGPQRPGGASPGSNPPGNPAAQNGQDAALYGARQARSVDDKPRCARCSKVLAWHVGRPWKIRCTRCGMDNGAT